jgi:hypothetical protein
MGVISVMNDTGIFVRCAHVFHLSGSPSPGEQYEFEVLSRDAAYLEERIGKDDQYVIEGQACWAKLVSLKTCLSTHPGLSLMRERPAMRGVFTIGNILSHPPVASLPV